MRGSFQILVVSVVMLYHFVTKRAEPNVCNVSELGSIKGVLFAVLQLCHPVSILYMCQKLMFLHPVHQNVDAAV